MLPVKNLIYASLLSLLAFAATADEVDEIDIRANFTNFWSSMAKQDFKGAAVFVHPLDLAALRTQLLPIFLKAGEVPNEGLQTVVEMFFKGVPKERRSQLSGPEIYVLLFKMLEEIEPDALAMFDAIRPEILEIKMDAPNKANVRFKIKVDIEPEDDEDKAAIEDVERDEETQLFGKLNGRWFLRMDESPADTAAEFKNKLGL